jgi:hypothetical protein
MFMLVSLKPLGRHAPPCAGHPAWAALCVPERDGRDKPGHDGKFEASDNEAGLLPQAQPPVHAMFSRLP